MMLEGLTLLSGEQVGIADKHVICAGEYVDNESEYAVDDCHFMHGLDAAAHQKGFSPGSGMKPAAALGSYPGG